MIHLGVVCLCALTACSCDAATGPSPFTRPPAPVPAGSPNPVADIRIRGQVLDDASRPVANARISSLFPSGGMVGVSPALSSSDGAFEFRAAGWTRGLDVTVDKESFETSIVRLSWLDAQAGDTVATNLRLHAIVRIPAGESASLTILDQRLQCSDDSESLPACRWVRVRAYRAGRLVLETRAPFVLGYAGWWNEQLVVDVASPGEIIVYVASLDPPPQEATVATRLEPK